MVYEDYLTSIFLLFKNSTDKRVFKLDRPFPNQYETKQNEFLETFFKEDPFEIKPADLDTLLTNRGKIKKLKSDRKPVTYYALFRFLELYRTEFLKQKQEMAILATIFKAFEEKKFQENDVLKEKVLNQLLAANRIYTKWQPQTETLFKLVIQNINFSLQESESINGKEKAFVNLRKVLSENFLTTTFHPYYNDLCEFCIYCIAHTVRLRADTKSLQEQVGDFSLLT